MAPFYVATSDRDKPAPESVMTFSRPHLEGKCLYGRPQANTDSGHEIPLPPSRFDFPSSRGPAAEPQ